MSTQINEIFLWLTQNWIATILGSVLIVVSVFFVGVTLTLLYHWLRYERNFASMGLFFIIYLSVGLILLAKAFSSAQILIS